MDLPHVSREWYFPSQLPCLVADFVRPIPLIAGPLSLFCMIDKLAYLYNVWVLTLCANFEWGRPSVLDICLKSQNSTHPPFFMGETQPKSSTFVLVCFHLLLQYCRYWIVKVEALGDPTSNEMAIKPAGKGPEIIAVYSCILALATVFVWLRLYTRLVIVKNIGTDDYFAGISWVSCLISIARPWKHQRRSN